MFQETLLFNKIIFGPLKSRRLGLSLGINLLPLNSKLCNFNCIYCECGWTGKRGPTRNTFHARSTVKTYLEEAMIQLKSKNIFPDAVTFAGNGEPTMHPEFSKIIDDTIELRNVYFPNAKVGVLTNATMLNRSSVVEALKKADRRILKLDAGGEDLFQKINQPRSRRCLSWVVDHLQYFNGDMIVQSMFLKGIHNGNPVDNTTDENVTAWLKLLEEIKPKQVMIYSIDRVPAEKGLEKIHKEILERIAMKVREIGIEAMAS
ncbi:MAG: radical SAM protein [Bacteroidetes bacterium]|nr:radical SAM protein [Bacteroidota bacterium]